MSDEKRCFYDLLGVPKDAAPDDVRRAYKREALKHHPDRNPGNTEAEVQFKAVNEAYQVLSDEEKRSIYDRFGHAGLDGSAGFSGGGIGDVFAHMQDLFTEMFSGGGGFGFGGRGARRGGDLRIQQRLTLAEAAFGCKREVSVQAPAPCDECEGSGAAKGTKPEQCPMCRGSGQVSNARGFVMFTAPCTRCQGRGVVVKTPCKPCGGHGFVPKTRKVTVAFPGGIDVGQRLRVPGQGLSGPNGNGDLYVEIDIEEDPRFERDGVDLVTRVHIPFALAALGGTVSVPTLEPDKADGDGAKSGAEISLPSGTQGGHIVTLKGRGVQRLDGRGRGSLIVEIRVDVPTKLSARARELLTMLDQELSGEVESSRKVASS